MHVTKPARPGNILAGVFLALGLALASCGGEGGNATNPAGGTPGGAAPGPVVSGPAPVAAGTGRLTVTVTDPDGGRLANARVSVYNSSQSTVIGTAISDRFGVAIIDAVPEGAIVYVDHPLGRYTNRQVSVQQRATSELTAVVQPVSPVTVALLPVTVPVGGISADRSELELQVTIVTSPTGRLVPSSYGSYERSLPTPYLRLDDCLVWLDFLRVTPKCEYTDDHVQVMGYAYHPVGIQIPPEELGPGSTLLLLDQSRRVREYDPYGLRTLAAKRFIRRARAAPEADLIAVAGFAGPGGDASSPPLLQQLPLWAPPNSATVFSADRFAQESALNNLESLVGGNAPVLAALGAAMTLTVAQGPANHWRAIVVLLGGGDDSGLTEPQRRAALASLRRQRSDSGMQVILIAGRLDEDSPERQHLAELAAALRAPIIYAGYPRNYLDQTDGLVGAFELAADLLAGSALPSLNATFRMKSGKPGEFLSGSTHQGTLWIESDQCPMGCWELPQQFAVEVP